MTDRNRELMENAMEWLRLAEDAVAHGGGGEGDVKPWPEMVAVRNQIWQLRRRVAEVYDRSLDLEQGHA